MKLYTCKPFENFEVSVVEKFFDGDTKPHPYNFNTDEIEENSVIFVHLSDFFEMNKNSIPKLRAIKNKKLVLLCHDKNLGIPNYTQIYTLTHLKKLLEECGFESQNIYLLCELKGEIPYLKQQLGDINIFNFCKWIDEFTECQINTYLKRFPGRNQQLFPVVDFKKLSICIRRFEKDRLDFMSRLVDDDILDDFNYSFTNHLGIDCKDTISHDEIKKMIPEGIKNKDKLVRWIDGMPYKYGSDIAFPYPLELDSLIVNSFVNVVFETSPKDSMSVITEKTYKPFFLLKPCIILSQPHALKLLRDSGFVTFGNLIDESYDSIEDYDERVEAIIREIQKIRNMDWYYLDNKFHMEMLGIFEHNFKLIVSEGFKKFPYNFTYRYIKYD